MSRLFIGGSFLKLFMYLSKIKNGSWIVGFILGLIAAQNAASLEIRLATQNKVTPVSMMPAVDMDLNTWLALV